MPVHNDRPGMRRRIGVIAVGAAAVLGVGAYAVTANLTGEDSHTAEPGTLTPAVSPSSTPPPASLTTAPATPEDSAPPASPSPVPTTATSRSSVDPKVRKQIDEARANQKKDGIELQRPLEDKGRTVPTGLTTTRTEEKPWGTIRITTARADLTGQQDLAMAGDGGTLSGRAHCTQKVRFSRNVPARAISNMMLCWRTSADRSVVTMAVAKKGRPTAADGAAVIAREWAKLG